ncbi:MAG: hypothetical protein ACXQTZ_03265, partial [Candidatus Alkanophagales archaeon]
PRGAVRRRRRLGSLHALPVRRFRRARSPAAARRSTEVCVRWERGGDAARAEGEREQFLHFFSHL